MNEEPLFKKYITTHFRGAHNPKEIIKELKITDRYFEKNYLRWLPENKEANIIELGCGMGHFLHFLQRQGYRNFMGVDISDEAVSFCRKMDLPVEKSNMFSFLEDKIDFYDVIIFNDVIEHLNKEEILRILDLIRNALKPGGILFIKTINMANVFTAIGGRYMDFTHQTGFTEESIQQVCHLSGFKDIRLRGLNIYVFYWNPLNYIAKLSSTLVNFIMKLLTRMYGRKSSTIFTKDILVICRKS